MGHGSCNVQLSPTQDTTCISTARTSGDRTVPSPHLSDAHIHSERLASGLGTRRAGSERSLQGRRNGGSDEASALYRSVTEWKGVLSDKEGGNAGL